MQELRFALVSGQMKCLIILDLKIDTVGIKISLSVNDDAGQIPHRLFLNTCFNPRFSIEKTT